MLLREELGLAISLDDGDLIFYLRFTIYDPGGTLNGNLCVPSLFLLGLLFLSSTGYSGTELVP